MPHEILFLGGPFHQQPWSLRSMPTLERVYVFQFPAKQPTFDAIADPMTRPIHMELDTIRFHYNPDFEDYVYTAEGMTEAQIDDAYCLWRDERDARLYA